MERFGAGVSSCLLWSRLMYSVCAFTNCPWKPIKGRLYWTRVLLKLLRGDRWTRRRPVRCTSGTHLSCCHARAGSSPSANFAAVICAKRDASIHVITQLLLECALSDPKMSKNFAKFLFITVKVSYCEENLGVTRRTCGNSILICVIRAKRFLLVCSYFF